MASLSDETGDGGDLQQDIAAEARQYELAELIAEQRERNELVARALDVEQQENQFHYDFLSKQLEVQEEQNKRRYRLVSLIVGGFALVLFLLLYMVFYGSEAQADKAEKLLLGIILLLGGFSLRDLIGRVQKRLIDR